jgi:hypothetical protein
MQIFLCRHDVDLLARPAAIGVRRRMQGLMDVAYEMIKKRKIAGSGPTCRNSHPLGDERSCLSLEFGRRLFSQRLGPK